MGNLEKWEKIHLLKVLDAKSTKGQWGAFINTDLGKARRRAGVGEGSRAVKASLEETAAFFWNVNSRVNTSSDPTVEVIGEKGLRRQ